MRGLRGRWNAVLLSTLNLKMGAWASWILESAYGGEDPGEASSSALCQNEEHSFRHPTPASDLPALGGDQPPLVVEQPGPENAGLAEPGPSQVASKGGRAPIQLALGPRGKLLQRLQKSSQSSGIFYLPLGRRGPAWIFKP